MSSGTCLELILVIQWIKCVVRRELSEERDDQSKEHEEDFGCS